MPAYLRAIDCITSRRYKGDATACTSASLHAVPAPKVSHAAFWAMAAGQFEVRLAAFNTAWPPASINWIVGQSSHFTVEFQKLALIRISFAGPDSLNGPGRRLRWFGFLRHADSVGRRLRVFNSGAYPRQLLTISLQPNWFRRLHLARVGPTTTARMIDYRGAGTDCCEAWGHG